MAAPLADTLPGGEKDLAARVRESCEWLAQRSWVAEQLMQHGKESWETRHSMAYTACPPAYACKTPTNDDLNWLTDDRVVGCVGVSPAW